MKLCPSCRTENSDSNVTCENCNTYLDKNKHIDMRPKIASVVAPKQHKKSTYYYESGFFVKAGKILAWVELISMIIVGLILPYLKPGYLGELEFQLTFSGFLISLGILVGAFSVFVFTNLFIKIVECQEQLRDIARKNEYEKSI